MTAAVLTPTSATGRQLQVLRLIADAGIAGTPATIRGLGRQLGITINAISDHIARLTDKGLVTKSGSPGQPGRLRVTDDGWKQLGRRPCEHCGGIGMVSA